MPTGAPKLSEVPTRLVRMTSSPWHSTPAPPPEPGVLHIDCGSCAARGPACDDCMMTSLLGPTDGAADLNGDEQAALRALSSSGVLPPLRLVVAVPEPEWPDDSW